LSPEGGGRVLNYPRKPWRFFRASLPIQGFHFNRPLVLFQSDDWGRVGLRDQEGLEQLRALGMVLGERPYDFYTLETAEDLAALCSVLSRHRDSGGRHPCVGMNFVLSNLDFAKMSPDALRIYLLSLAEGLPQGWTRPGLVAGYRQGIADGVFFPALHGRTHFCQSAVERNLSENGERAALLRTLWRVGTPYIHWRMPWVGYEYWDAEKPEAERMLAVDLQRELIGQTVGMFAKMFSTLPHSACAPGYRANDDTFRAWAQHGIQVAQNGPGMVAPPHFDRFGTLHLFRTVEFEPATDAAFSVEKCLRDAEACFERGLPAIVSLHSINFHSTARDFCSFTLRTLDEFLTALESKHEDLLYLHDENLYGLASTGAYQTPQGTVRVNVTRKTFTRAGLVRQRRQ